MVKYIYIRQDDSGGLAVFLQRIWKNRQSVVLTWLVSYLTLLFVPIVLSIGVYVEAGRMLRSEINRANDSLLKQVREVVDNQIANIERLDNEITWNPRVQDLMYSANRNESDYIFNAYKISQDLKLYQSFYGFIDGFYVYSVKGDFAILPGTQRSGKFAFETIHQGGELSYEGWRELVTRKNFRGFVRIPHRGGNGNLQYSLAYISSFITGKDEQPVGTIVIMIDAEQLMRTIANLHAFNGGEVLILNKDNQVLVSDSQKEQAFALQDGKLAGASGLIYDKYEGQKAEYVYLKSNNSELKYVTIMPTRFLWQKAEYVRKLTYASIMISILGGSLLMLFFIRRNYNPVSRLIEAIAGKSGIPYQRTDNEFQFIQNAFSDTLGETEKIKQRLKQQDQVVRNNLIARLLKGQSTAQIPLQESMAAFGMKFDSDDFAVVLFYLEDSEAFFSNVKGMDAHGKVRLLHFIITNVVEELAAQNHRGYVAEIDDSIVCLINFRDGHADRRSEYLRRLAEEASQFLLNRFRIKLKVAFSGIHNTFMGIPQAYSEALNVLEYQIVIGGRDILSYADIEEELAGSPHHGYYYPIQVEQQLINYMKVGDFAKARQTLNSIFENNFTKPAVSVQLAKCLMFNLVSTMIKTINEIGDVEDFPFLRNPKEIDRFFAGESVKDMHRKLTEMLENVCDYTAEKRKQSLKQARNRSLQQLVREISSFVEGHYDDSNLNISMIGRRFDMKPTYLSKLFKEQTSEGLLDYINKVRIAKAKQIIGEHGASIGDVAKLVGFSEVTAFIRVFKKYEGITPGKYKETLN
jgi:AraC-like DNA-binding protein